MAYEITFSITAVCPCCGKDLPSNSYLTVSKPSTHPLDRDNPYERKDRRVFITPCAECFEPRRKPDSATSQPNEDDPGPKKVYGLMVLEKSQKPLIEKHCFGDCGKISMAGAIHDHKLGGLMVCCEDACPWLLKQMDKAGDPYGTTMSFGRPHAVYLRTLTDTPASAAPATSQPKESGHD